MLSKPALCEPFGPGLPSPRVPQAFWVWVLSWFIFKAWCPRLLDTNGLTHVRFRSVLRRPVGYKMLHPCSPTWLDAHMAAGKLLFQSCSHRWCPDPGLLFKEIPRRPSSNVTIWQDLTESAFGWMALFLTARCYNKNRHQESILGPSVFHSYACQLSSNIIRVLARHYESGLNGGVMAVAAFCQGCRKEIITHICVFHKVIIISYFFVRFELSNSSSFRSRACTVSPT